MRFADLLKLQQSGMAVPPAPPGGTPPGAAALEAVHAQAVSEQALNPRACTEPLLAYAQQARKLWTAEWEAAHRQGQTTGEDHLAAAGEHQTAACVDLFENRIEALNQIEIQKAAAFRTQAAQVRAAQADLAEPAAVPDHLAPLRDTTQYDSLQGVIKQAAQIPEDALPITFRVLSRKNENYGANAWPILPAGVNAPETLFQLLMGTFDDAYQADCVPVQTSFLHGSSGSFVLNQNLAYPVGFNDATGSAPLAAVASLALANTTDSEQVCQLSFALSSYNFAGVFLKAAAWQAAAWETAVWTPLFQTAANLVHTSVRTEDFTLGPGEHATVLWAATPYYYRESHLEGNIFDGGSHTVYNSHAVQHLQLGILNLREVYRCLSH